MLLDKGSQKEIKDFFSPTVELPTYKNDVCNTIINKVNENIILGYFNQNSGNWHHYIQLCQTISAIDSAFLVNFSNNIPAGSSFTKLGEFSEDGISGISLLYKNLAEIYLRDGGEARIENLPFYHIIILWTYKDYLIVHITLSETDFSRWVPAIVVTAKVENDYDAIIQNLITSLNYNKVTISEDPVSFQNATKELYTEDKYKINRSRIINVDGGQSDISLPDQKFFYSDVINLGYTAKALNEAFIDKTRSHRTVFSYWQFDGVESRIDLWADSGILRISNNLLLKYKIEMIKSVIDRI